MAWKLVWQVCIWKPSSQDDGSKPTELCVCMSGPVYHLLLCKQLPCAYGVPMTEPPGCAASTPVTEQSLHCTSVHPMSSTTTTLPHPNRTTLPPCHILTPSQHMPPSEGHTSTLYQFNRILSKAQILLVW